MASMTRAAIAFALCALSFTAAGCGGEDDASATEDWAGGLCSSLSAWSDSITSATESVKDNPSADGLQSAVDDVKQATSTLTGDLDALGKPDTEAGQEAKDAIDELATSLETEIDEIESATGGGAAALSTLVGSLTTISSQVSSTFDQLEQLDGSDELQSAFENADSCDELRSNS
jgi:uncharacterized phage infection (PIP) family protein YhgE